MSRRFKKFFLLSIVVGLGGVTIIIIAYHIITSGWFIKKYVIPAVYDSTGIKVKMEDITVAPFSSLYEFRNIRVGGGERPFFKAKKVICRIKLTPLISSKTLEISELKLEKPELYVIKDENNRWNLPFLRSKRISGSSKTEGDKVLPFTEREFLFSLKNIKIEDMRFYLKIKSKRDAESVLLNIYNLNLGIPILSLYNPLQLESYANFEFSIRKTDHNRSRIL